MQPILPTTRPSPVTRILAAANAVILGKSTQTRLALCCLLAKGHLLIEDLPGVGKTTLAHTLARVLGFQFARIQFTSDMLPADILGVSIFDRESGNFRFLPGPVFSQVLLADEINRATPKTQSALLEAMEEGQVTTEGETRPLPEPFFVIATQNPSTQIGTFPLPESQLDRFLLRIELGYPDHDAERALLESGGRREQLPTLSTCLGPGEFAALQQRVSTVYSSPALLDYLQALVEATRQDARLVHGLSPRAALSLLAVARAWAFSDGRQMVLPEDLQAVLPAVACHRLRLLSGSHAGAEDIAALIRSLPLP
ncbi:MAG: MoxR family ATPase [Candidatus Accumulibacter phosphatis]|uniref:Recombination factor protein RarA n=2 Tax=Candidatus Accumulibacter TaxID=327159 RepID=A0A080M7C4_9PROT|nr:MULTISPECIES: MoxR family ATPase [Candidatus Accumulibacter]KFB73009.1 MAG: recombination factor protein RarA [Candidatus Accumulibacter phosphatis]NMQ05319.1 MoxR family ATPase [Candidatus Accumulibacter contiguus]HRF11277.1 MoxR family ATPase [Candidatus Accumulibacter phosphatis]